MSLFSQFGRLIPPILVPNNDYHSVSEDYELIIGGNGPAFLDGHVISMDCENVRLSSPIDVDELKYLSITFIQFTFLTLVPPPSSIARRTSYPCDQMSAGDDTFAFAWQVPRVR
jgi:hypothetical protein